MKQYKVQNIILDPVMVATSGDILINEKAIDSLKHFLPTALLITPNKSEAEILWGKKIIKENAQQAVIDLGEKYQTSVLLKAGNLDKTKQKMTDILYEHENKQTTLFTNTQVKTLHTHGTGCSLSSSIATFIGLGENLNNAVKKGIHFVHKAIVLGSDKQLGKGTGPINHFGLK